MRSIVLALVFAGCSAAAPRPVASSDRDSPDSQVALLRASSIPLPVAATDTAHACPAEGTVAGLVEAAMHENPRVTASCDHAPMSRIATGRCITELSVQHGERIAKLVLRYDLGLRGEVLPESLECEQLTVP